MKKHLLSLLLICSMLVFLTGCGKDFDASGYVQGYMDTCLKGDGTNYAELCGVSEEETTEVYEEGIDEVVDGWLTGVSLSDESKSEVESAVKALFKKTSYSVGKAEKQDDGSYSVPVTIQPLEIKLDTAAMQDLQTETMSQYMEAHPEDESLSDTEALGNLLATEFAAYLTNISENPTYAEEVTKNVTVSIQDKQYMLSEEDQYTLITSSVATGTESTEIE